MAYETSTSTGPVDLLDKLRIFLLADGWTITRLDGTPGNSQLTVDTPTTGAFFSFEPVSSGANSGWKCQPHTSDSGDVVFDQHPGSPNTDTSDSTGTFVKFGSIASSEEQGFAGNSIAYHFFTGTTTDGEYCHVVLEGDTDVFWHLAFGMCEKAGGFTGGQYMTATNFTDQIGEATWAFNVVNGFPASGAGWVRADDDFTGISVSTDATSRWFQWIAFAGNYGANSSQMFAPLYQGGLQAWNQRSSMCPIWLHAWNSLTPNTAATAFILLGHIPDMRFISMDGRDPGETLTIGGDDWLIFPMHMKRSTNQDTVDAYTTTDLGSAPRNSSNLMGLAYRKVS